MRRTSTRTGRLLPHRGAQFSVDDDPKLVERRYTWLGVYAHNGFHGAPERAGLYYWAQIDFLTGTREETDRFTDRLTPVQRSERDVDSWAVDGGVRLRFTVPFAIGAAYAIGDGGGDDNESKSFEQTGLHSNRSRFTGTRSLLYRYNEALQPDLSNLQVLSLFASVPTQRFDASLVYHYFERNKAGAPVITDGIDVAPQNAAVNLGEGLDLVLSYYFGMTPKTAVGDREDLRSNVRLRGSLFRPGEAYGDDLDDQYRVMLETTLWF